jgi:TP901 family phage tail tape measure protein
MAVVIPIIADVKGLTRGIGNTEKQLNRLSKNVGAIGSSMTRNVTLPIIGAGAAAIAFATQFNKGMANVATLIPGNVARVNELKQDIMDLGPATGKSLKDLTDGMYQVISAFGDTADSVKILEVNARAATAGLATTTDAINLTSAVTKGYGDTSAKAVEQASDLALLTVRLGQTTFPELAASIGKVIPLASSLNVTQEELFASMATLTGVTGGAAEVATQMRGAMQSLLAPTADATKAITAAGFANGEALIKQKGFAGAIGFLVDEAKKAGVPLQKYISSIEGQTFALALAGAQSKDYENKLGAMAKAQGTSDQAFVEATTGLGAAAFGFAQLRSNVEVMAVSLGDGLAPALNVVMQNAKPLVDRIVDLSKRFAAADAETQGFIIKILATVAAIGPMLIVVSKAIQVFSALRSIIIAVKAAQIGLNLAMIANPIGLIVLAVVALAAAFLVAYNRSETFRNIVNAIGTTIRDNVITAFEWLKQKIDELTPAMQSAYQTILPVLKAIGTIIKTAVIVYVKAVSTYIKAWGVVLSAAWEVIQPVAKKIGEVVKNYIVFNFRLAKGVIDGVATAIDGIKRAIDGIKAAGGKVASFFDLRTATRQMNVFTKTLRDAVKSARDSLVGSGSSLAGMMSEIVNVRTPFRGGASSEMLGEQRKLEDRRLALQEQRLKDELAAAEDKTEAQLALDEFYFQKDSALRQRSIDDENTSNTTKITNLVDSFNKGLISADKFRVDLDAIIGGETGDTLGNAFATAFRLQIESIIGTVQDIFGAVGLRLPTSASSSDVGGVLISENQRRFQEALDAWQKARDARRKKAVDYRKRATSDGGSKITDAEEAEIRNLMAAWDRENKRPQRRDFGLALGGVLNQQVFTAGEAGPEAVMPLTGRGGAMLRDALGLDGRQGATYNITVNAGMGASGIDLGREIVDAIKKYERTNGNVFAGA